MKLLISFLSVSLMDLQCLSQSKISLVSYDIPNTGGTMAQENPGRKTDVIEEIILTSGIYSGNSKGPGIRIVSAADPFIFTNRGKFIKRINMFQIKNIIIKLVPKLDFHTDNFGLKIKVQFK